MLRETSGEDGADKKGLSLAVIWRACAVVGGMYLFYMFELLLHKLTDRTSSNEVSCIDRTASQTACVQEMGCII